MAIVFLDNIPIVSDDDNCLSDTWTIRFEKKVSTQKIVSMIRAIEPDLRMSMEPFEIPRREPLNIRIR